MERIAADSAGRRVVMLNEAHVASRHRMFLAQVLRKLRPLGFTHLAAETFPNEAPGARWSDLGAAFDPAEGTYTHDPVFAEAVREAADLGYRFVAYEQRQDQRGPPGEDRNAAIARREQSQAENFAAFATAHPEARTLTFVGYAHLRKTPDRAGNEWFAARLTRQLGVAPLTVEQSTTGSFGPHAPDTETARAVLARFSPKRPIVVTEGGAVVGVADGRADLAVFHPSLPDVAGRPGWLAADAMRRSVRVAVPSIAVRGLTLAQAIPEGELETGVPADQYVLPYGAREAVFLLRPGRYRFRLEASSGFSDMGKTRVA